MIRCNPSASRLVGLHGTASPSISARKSTPSGAVSTRLKPPARTDVLTRSLLTASPLPASGVPAPFPPHPWKKLPIRLVVIAALSTLVAAGPATASAIAPTLSYTAAKKAAKKRADQLAGQATKVGTMIRQSRVKWYAQASWTRVDPAGCKGCGYNFDSGQTYDTPSSTPCFVGLHVQRSTRTGRIAVRVSEKVCD